jgi:hypothetical protein
MKLMVALLRAAEFRETSTIVFGEYVALAVGINRHRTLAGPSQ